MTTSRSLGGHPSSGTSPAHLAGLDADPSAPDCHLSPGSVQAGGADFEGDVTIEDEPDRFAKRAGRPKAKHENIPTHFQT